MAEIDALNQAAPAAIGAVAGGGGVLWIAKLLLGRMIEQYDRKHDQADAKLTRLSETLAESKTQIEILKVMVEDAKNIRSNLEKSLSELKGEWNAKHTAAMDEVDDLRADLYVAHERLRLLAAESEIDVSGIQKPSKMSKRR